MLSVGTKGDSCFYSTTAREVSATFCTKVASLTLSDSLFFFTCFGQFLFQAQAPHRHSCPSYFQHTRLNEHILSIPFPKASPKQIAPEIRRMVYAYLPPFEDARGMYELFLNYSSFMCMFLRVSSSLSDDQARASSLAQEELLHVLETVYHQRCVPSVSGLMCAPPD